MIRNLYVAFLLLVHVTLVGAWQLVYAYTRGVWFLVRHPIQFITFVDEWAKYRSAIADADDIRSSGYYNMSRRQRRSMEMVHGGVRGGRHG